MGTEVAKTQLNKLSKAQLLAGLDNSVKESNTRTFEYLHFSGKEGKFTVPNGTENPPELAMGTKLLVNLMASQKGYVCWKDGQVVDEWHTTIFSVLPQMDENGVPQGFEDHGPYEDPNREGWQQSFILMFKAPDANKQYQFKTNSKSGVNSVGNMLSQVREQAALHDIETETPLVVIDAEKFKNRKGGKQFVNYKPVFEVTEWLANPQAIAAAPEAAALPGPKDDKAPISDTAKALDAEDVEPIEVEKKKSFFGRNK